MSKLNVSGMTCQNCVKHVKNAIESFSGIKDVSVDLEQNSASFDLGDSNISIDDVILEISEAGYTATE